MSDLDDPLLARARMLLDAAKQTNEIIKPTVNIEIPAKVKTGGKPNKDSKSDDRMNKVFGATVFKGSTLINTHEDVRQYVGRGDQIVVDGYCLTIAQGEWTATCIEITSDFPGDNNFSASLSIATANNILNSPKRKKPMVPIATESIQNAVAELNNFKELYVSKIESNIEPIVTDRKINSGKLKGTKKNKPRNTAADLPYQSSFLSSNGGSGGIGGNYSNNYNFQPPAVNLASSSAFPSNSLYNNNDYNYNNNSNHSTNNSPPNDSYAYQPTSTKVNHPVEYPLSAIEQVNMVNRHILDFNEQRKQQPAVDPVKLANERIKQKLLEEAKVKELLEKEKEKKKLAEVAASELKVNELKARTQERVAKYKESLLKKAESEKIKQELELFEKKEREKELSTEAYKKKLIEQRKQSQRRLRQIALADERREQEKHLQMQAKLDAISKKYDVLSTYATPAVMAQRVQAANSKVEGSESGSQAGSRPVSGVRKPSKKQNNSHNVNSERYTGDYNNNNNSDADGPWDPYADIDPAYAGLYGNDTAAVLSAINVTNHKPAPTTKFQPIPRGDDEWSEDEPDDDSIEMSKHSNSYYNNNSTNKGGNAYSSNKQPPSYGQYDYPVRDDDNLSDVSGDGNTQLRGNEHVAYQKSSSAKGMKPSNSSLLPPGRPSSQPLTPIQTKSSSSKLSQVPSKLPIIKHQSISNSSSASSIHANQIFQQQAVQQSMKLANNPNYKPPRPQQQPQQAPPSLPLQYSNASPPEKKNSPKKPTGVWRKLQPIPIAPYQAIPTVQER